MFPILNANMEKKALTTKGSYNFFLQKGQTGQKKFSCQFHSLCSAQSSSCKRDAFYYFTK